MKPNHKFFFLLILGLASILRFYSLGTNPPSLDWDEVSLGYNAYSILETGRDEYGNFLPFSIRSFNDYKPPAYVYLTIPSVAIFGLTDFAIRLPSAIMGVLAVILIYFLTKEIFIEHKNRHLLCVLSSSFLALSPWHLQFSRAAFEANVALTFYLSFLFFFLKWVNQKHKLGQLEIRSIILLLLSSLSAIAALYSYHSARLVVPLMLLSLAAVYRQRLIKHWKQIIPPILLAFALLTPLAVISFRGSTSERFAATSVFTNPGEFSRERERIDRIAKFKSEHSGIFSQLHKRSTVYGKIILRNYFEHFNFDFLFLRGDGNPRHSTTGMGLIYLIELPLLLSGIYHLAGSKFRHKHMVWLILLLGPTAASLTASTPHAIRSLLMLPAIPLLSAFGAVKLSQIEIKSISKKIPIIVYCFLFIANFAYYLNLYHVIYPVTAAKDWQYGYHQLVEKVGELESDYDHIIITNEYDQPHIYFAFYGQIPPTEYQQFAETASSGFGKYSFKSVKFDEDSRKTNTIIAVGPDRSPTDQEPLYQIKFPDGTIAFNLFETNK